MCFSAPASFIAASGLSTVGVLSLRQARERRLVPLALIPFFFALQQAFEGVVWLTFDNRHEVIHKLGVHGFLFFASMWWPVYIATTFFIAEKNSVRKKLLLVPLLCGVSVTMLYIISWIIYEPEALVVDHHIAYPLISAPFNSSSNNLLYLERIMSYLYMISTIMPLFISSIKFMWVVGSVISILCLLALLFFAPIFASMWCFFSAVSSVLLYIILVSYRRSQKTASQ